MINNQLQKRRVKSKSRKVILFTASATGSRLREQLGILNLFYCVLYDSRLIIWAARSCSAAMDFKEIRIGVMIDYHCHSLLSSSERLRCSTSTGHTGKGSGRYLLVSYGGISLRARCEGAVLIHNNYSQCKIWCVCCGGGFLRKIGVLLFYTSTP